MIRPPHDWTHTVARTRSLIDDPATDPVVREQLVESLGRYEQTIAGLLSSEEGRG